MVNHTKDWIAIIPARGGSIRIPHKNIVDVGGKPLIAWTIEAALQSKCFDDVMVSTEDETIKKVALQYGASIPFLRTKYFDNISGVNDVAVWYIKQLQIKLNLNYKNICILQPSSPLRTSKDIIEMIKFHKIRKSQSTESISKFYTPIAWACKLQNQTLTPLFKNGIKTRSQALESFYFPTGAIRLISKELLIKYHSFLIENITKGYELSFEASIDIDSPDNLELIRKLVNVR